MADNTIGTAYLQIRPSMEGVKGELEQAMGDAGKSGSSSFGSAFSSGISAVAKATTAALGTAVAGVSALTKSAVDSFADYEQLTGGIETLFGDDAEAVLKNAELAFKSAGMSTNDYMETTIQSAASLISSLEGDTAKAADLMDMSITDMADNVNKMGTSMEAVQNAYRGFSRGNFTMLDNLALGFAGTAEGMQELLDKAEEISGIEYNIDSYSDIVEAIHVVQEEMGITGTTAKEASGTISGSIASMGAAWQNLVTGIADPNQDLGVLIDNVIEAGTTALSNLMPTIEHALLGIGEAVTKVAPIIAQMLPNLVTTLIPPLIDAAIQLVNALVGALPDILGIIVQQIPMLFNLIVETVISLLPVIIDLGLQLILALADGLIQNLPTLIPAVVDVILTIVDKLTDPDTLVQLVDAALQLIIALAEGLIRALPKLIAKAPEIVKNFLTAIIQAAPMILEAGAELLFKLIEGILMVVGQLVTTGAELVESVKEGFWQKIEDAKNWGKDMIQNFIDGIKAKWENLKSTVTDLASTIKSLLGFSEPEAGPLSNFHTFAPDMMQLFASGIRDNLGLIQSAMGDVTGTLSADFTTAQIAPNNYSGIANPYEGLSGLIGQNSAAESGDIVIPVYIGQEKLDTIILNAQQRHALVSGGR